MICENYFYNQNENCLQNNYYNYYYQYYEDNYNYEQYYSKILDLFLYRTFNLFFNNIKT